MGRRVSISKSRRRSSRLRALFWGARLAAALFEARHLRLPGLSPSAVPSFFLPICSKVVEIGGNTTLRVMANGSWQVPARRYRKVENKAHHVHGGLSEATEILRNLTHLQSLQPQGF